MQHIVVVNIDNKLDSSTLQQVGVEIPFVGPDNRAGARTVGTALATHLHRGDKAAILEGIPTAFNAQQRRLGFEDAMREAGVDVVAVQSAHWEQDEANTVTAAILREHPDLKAILASNDNMALGRGRRSPAGRRNRQGARRWFRQHCGGPPARSRMAAWSRRRINMPIDSPSSGSNTR